MIVYAVSYISYASSFINIYRVYEGMSFIPLSEDHYILREIMLRRTKGINI
jgi:spore coat polysaccharide biosynthesis predicted glycosyltransferase SpsG